MIRGLVDFALNNRFLVVIIAILLFGWGNRRCCFRCTTRESQPLT